jgi:polysaccharide pyruvyl transferase CsaB
LANNRMILVVGYYGFGNIGNETILSIMLAQLRDKRPELRVVVASGNPRETEAAHGVQAVAWNDMAGIHRAVQVSDLVIVGGGGLFHDYWGVDPDSFLTDQHWGIAYYAGPALLATLYRKPLMFYAVGVGPLISGHGRKLTRIAAQAAHVITVRDPGSKTLLQELGVPAGRIRITADPACAFQPAVTSNLEHLLDPGFDLRRPVLGVTPRHWSVGVHPDFLEREFAAAFDLFLEQTGGSVVFVPFQHLSGERENDRATAQRLLDHMRLRDKAAIFHDPATPENVFGALGECDLVLGMRLHALLFAANAGVPAVAVSYDPKVDEFIKRLGVEGFSVKVKDVTAPQLASQLVQALTRGGEFRESVGQAMLEQRQAAEENVSIALALLDGPQAEVGLSLESMELLARSLAQFAARDRGRLDQARALSEQGAQQLTQAGEAYRALSQRLEEVLEQFHASEQAAVRESARFVQDRDWLKTELAQAVQQGAHARDRLQTAERETRSLSLKLEEVTATRSALEATLTDLRSKTSHERNAMQAALDHDALRLKQADEARAYVVSEVDHFNLVYRRELETYRAQRAWKVMLACRKAYTLLQQSKAQFLAWLLRLPFSGPGPLEPYELKFPDLDNYFPASFRRPMDGIPAVAIDQPAAEDSIASDLDTPPQRDRYDVVILAIIDFDFRFQRPQQIAAEFARTGHRVFWISPTRFLPASSPKPYEVHPLRDNLWEIHLRSRQPDIYMGDLKPDDVTAMSDALDHLYRDWTIAEHTVLVQLPFWRRLALKVRGMFGSKVLYDCMDDWETFENMGAFNVAEEKQFVHECDVLIVTGAELQRKFEAQGLKPVLARNGADYPFFAKTRANHLLADVPKPVVGYFGAIADWIDLDLVYEVARSRPQYSFVMIGQVFGRDMGPLQSLPNVRLLGSKPYADIPEYLYHFDACTIPFLINQVTKATDPVKLYEYFSLGKPVVATNMAELSQCGDLVHIGHDPQDFARKLDIALSEKDGSLRERRIEFAKANTWSSRVKDIDGAVRESFPLVSILIVAYNSAPFVRPCLDSILRNASYPNYEVILIDNASTDDTGALLKEYGARDNRLRPICLDRNLGFAGGNNHAAQQAQGEYLIFLNIDTMVTSGWIERLLRHVRQDPSIGLLCPVTNFAGNEIKINVSYTGWQQMERFARALAAARSGQRLEIGVAPLYCALMPRAVWERVGEMDTRYEIGMFEDDDLSLRVRAEGFGVFAAEDCFIHHFGQGSFSKLASETYDRIFEANRKRFEEKWKRSWAAHKTRPGVRPAFEEKRFDPVDFTR